MPCDVGEDSRNAGVVAADKDEIEELPQDPVGLPQLLGLKVEDPRCQRLNDVHERDARRELDEREAEPSRVRGHSRRWAPEYGSTVTARPASPFSASRGISIAIAAGSSRSGYIVVVTRKLARMYPIEDIRHFHYVNGGDDVVESRLPREHLRLAKRLRQRERFAQCQFHVVLPSGSSRDA